MKNKLLLLSVILLLGIVGMSRAQNAENKWGIGLHFGVMEYSGDYDKEFYSFRQGYAVGASLSRYINPSFDIMGHFFYDMSHANDNGRMGMPTWLNFEADMFNLNLLAKYKFNNGYILKEEALLSPFILAGVGGNFALTSGVGENGAFTSQKYITPNLYGGLGLNLRISKAISFVVQTAVMLPFTDKIDGTTGAIATAAVKGNDKFMENSVGLCITPGKAKIKDSDGDGVNDKLDKCPGTPTGVPVDADGCPLDSDKDGILDYQDECPFVFGLKEFNGCPDTDKDGIQDKFDECPDVFGLKEFKGCPDTDGDGVPDKDDRCPNTPKGVKVDKFGCTLDTDGDGIPDSEDACPLVAGVKELNGCPYDVTYIIGKYSLTMTPIYFDFDKYVLKTEGIDALNKIANALSNHLDFGVQFDGYCDFMGTEEYNLKLSEKRANAAKLYLINKGITDNRIRLQYYGEANPAADNQTEKGRALNRRVEYNLYDTRK
ncbi:MAG: OmpA family protein [Bacteroidales bacterium]|jgi:outer membrane protein OmpA-like peptidoglycan-associated protein